MLMLDYGAESDVSGFGLSPVLRLVVAGQSIILIRQLVEKGVDPRGPLDRAVRWGRSDVNSCLLGAGFPFSII